MFVDFINALVILKNYFPQNYIPLSISLLFLSAAPPFVFNIYIYVFCKKDVSTQYSTLYNLNGGEVPLKNDFKKC